MPDPKIGQFFGFYPVGFVVVFIRNLPQAFKLAVFIRKIPQASVKSAIFLPLRGYSFKWTLVGHTIVLSELYKWGKGC
jgi:hypothetical protein